MMLLRGKKNTCKVLVSCIGIWVGLFSIAITQAVEVDVTLTNGLIQRVNIQSVSTSSVTARVRGAASPRVISLNKVSKIDFPEPGVWKQANTFFLHGDYPKAIAAFSSISKAPQKHYFPAPGNYASLARLRLIECYRETGNAKGIVAIARTLNGGSLPQSLRGEMALISCWAKLGQGKWDEALTEVNSLEVNPVLPGRADLGFIKGVALEKKGKIKEAILAYSEANAVDFGGSRELSKRAIKNAILLLASLKDENRSSELHSLVHIYAKVYNQGTMWEGAPAQLTELLDKKLPTSAEVDSESGDTE